MLKLKIVSPEKIEFTGEVESVTVPGALGNFQILTGHAPLISSLTDGKVEYTTNTGENNCIAITGGVASVHKDEVSLCVEKQLA